MGLSGGIMLAVVVFDLMKESMDKWGTLYCNIYIYGCIINYVYKNKTRYC